MIEIPVIDAADQQMGLILNNRRVTLRLRYNIGTNRWSFDLSIDDQVVLHGQRMTLGVDLFAPFSFGLGKLFLLSVDGVSLPGRTELPSRLVRLYHVSDEEFEQLRIAA